MIRGKVVGNVQFSQKIDAHQLRLSSFVKITQVGSSNQQNTGLISEVRVNFVLWSLVLCCWTVRFATEQSVLQLDSPFCNWTVRSATGQSVLQLNSPFCTWTVRSATGLSILCSHRDKILSQYQAKPQAAILQR